RPVGHRSGRNFSGDASFDSGPREFVDRVCCGVESDNFTSSELLVADWFRARGLLFHFHLATLCRKGKRSARHSRFLLVLYNRYDLPIVEFKMARRQGATREHVLHDLRPRRNAGAGPFSTQPCGPQFFRRISASLARPVSQRIQALRSLLEIRPKSLRRLASHTSYTTLRWKS